MLTNRQKYDYRDVDIYELKLIRAGHYLWGRLKRARLLKCRSVGEERSLEAAIDIIVDLKRQYREELKVKVAAKSARVRKHFASKRLGRVPNAK